MKNAREYIGIYCVGSLGYSTVELMWRGHTHWSMGIAGGVGLVLLYLINRRMNDRVLLIKCAAGTAALTAVEFSSGCVLNLMLRLQVWDYSRQPGNILGQICPLYCLYWFVLCIPVMKLNSYLQK